MSAMCRVMEVSSAGFYGWVGREESARDEQNQVLLVHIKSAHKASYGRYGSPRIYHKLRQNGVACSENRVARVMRKNGIRAVQARKFRSTTDSDHTQPIAENVLGREFAVENADTAWCGDITYIWTTHGWLYLAIIMDLCTRRIVGWSARTTMHRNLVLDALGAALKDRRPPTGLVHHSDRGSQYASNEYRAELEAAGITCSMSRKGNCWDNAPAESFFATLKQELVYQHAFETPSEAKHAMFEFIEVWYNRQRLHSSLGYMTPVDYEALLQQQSTNQAA